MFFISHRGNLKGPNKTQENKIEYIDEALKKNFDVEIDLWFVKKNFFLGHDEPLYKVDRKYLKNKKFWIHAKNLDCFYELNNSKLNYFTSITISQLSPIVPYLLLIIILIARPRGLFGKRDV